MAKHAHACELEQKLNLLCREALSSGPKSSIVANADRTAFDIEVSGVPTVGVEIALLAGDLIHNLRSVLDHLAWTLATVRSRDSDFPIRREPLTRKDGSSRPSAIKGVTNKQVQDMVEAVQPYNRTNSAENPLWLLREFDIIDKHRLLLTTYCVATGTSHSIDRQGENDPELTYWWDQMGDGDTFARVAFKSPVDDFNPDFHITLEVALRLEDADVAFPLINTVFQMRQEVAKTVNMFNAFL
jgi:hypothetical protein